MKISSIFAILIFLCSCYTMNPDGTVNIPKKNLDDIEGHWIGLNENYLLGIALDINSDGSGSLLVTLLNEVSDPIKVAVSIDNNVVKISPMNQEIENLTFQLEPTFMIMSIDQISDQMHFKLSLIKEEFFKKKIEVLTNR